MDFLEKERSEEVQKKKKKIVTSRGGTKEIESRDMKDFS